MRFLRWLFKRPRCECHLGNVQWHKTPRECPVHGDRAFR